MYIILQSVQKIKIFINVKKNDFFIRKYNNKKDDKLNLNDFLFSFTLIIF